MKRTAAILLMGILAFNWFGYQLLNAYLEGRANLQLEAQLDDNNYDESQLISIKVPLMHLTDYTSPDGFERIDGQVEIAGVQYKYVKRRLFKDSLELMCIPNYTVMKLQTANNEFFKMVNDLQAGGQGRKSDPHSGSSKMFSADYNTVAALSATADRYFTVLQRSSRDGADPVSCYFPAIEQPPDHC